MITTTTELRRRINLPLVLGRLVADRDGLRVVAFCPGCRESHTFDWPDESTALGRVETFDAPCRDLGSPFRGGRIAVGLNPDHATRNRQVHTDPLRAVAPTAELFAELAHAALPAPEPTPDRLDLLARWASRRPALARIDLADVAGRMEVERAFLGRAVALVAAGRRWAAGGRVLIRGVRPWAFESLPVRFTKRDGLDVALLNLLAGLENCRSRHPEGGYRLVLARRGAGHPELEVLDQILDEAGV